MIHPDRAPSDIALDFAGRLARGFVVGCNVLADDGEPLTETQRVALLTHLFLVFDGSEATAQAMCSEEGRLRFHSEIQAQLSDVQMGQMCRAALNRYPKETL